MVLRRAMDAGWHGAAGPSCRDAPEGEGAEGVGRRAWLGSVMRVVAVLLQELGETGVVLTAVFLEQRRADLGNRNLQQGVLVAQAFAARAVIGAEPGVDLDGRAVDVERRDVGRYRSGVRIAHAVIDAIKRRSEVVVAQELLICEHRLRGEATSWTEFERTDAFVLERHDAFAGPKLRDHLGEVARQLTFPAEGVDALGEGRPE